jgi:hypothetical protein
VGQRHAPWKLGRNRPNINKWESYQPNTPIYVGGIYDQILSQPSLIKLNGGTETIHNRRNSADLSVEQNFRNFPPALQGLSPSPDEERAVYSMARLNDLPAPTDSIEARTLSLSLLIYYGN